MKKLAILVMVLTGALGAAVWWTSLRAQQEARRIVAMLDAQPEIRVLESDYQPGWLTSRSSIHFELRGFAGAGFQSGLEALDHPESRARIGLNSVHTIDHGLLPLIEWIEAGGEGTPVVAHVDSQVELDQETRVELREALGRLPAMHARMVVRASGVVEADFDMPVAELRPKPDPEDPSTVTGRFGGLRGSAVLSTAEGSAAGSVSLPELAVNDAAFDVEIGGIEMVFDGARHPSGVWVGSLTQRVGLAAYVHRDLSELPPDPWQMRDQDGKAPADAPMGPAMPAALAPADIQLSAEQVELRVESRVSGAFLEATLDFEAMHLSTAGREAEFRELSQVAGSLSVASVNAETLGGLWLGDESVGAGPREWLTRLAPSKPELRLPTLTARSSAGTLNGSGTLRLREAPRADDAWAGELDRALSGELSLDGPSALIGDPEGERLVSLEEDGWVALRGPRFRVKLVLEDGVLTSHGTEVPWPGREPEELAAKDAPAE
ncbi:MAG: DUF945 family protein [Myxococcota bacterium]|nr:DUF945 family protein [Myxococcota bacterium]